MQGTPYVSTFIYQNDCIASLSALLNDALRSWAFLAIYAYQAHWTIGSFCIRLVLMLRWKLCCSSCNRYVLLQSIGQSRAITQAWLLGRWRYVYHNLMCRCGLSVHRSFTISVLILLHISYISEHSSSHGVLYNGQSMEICRRRIFLSKGSHCHIGSARRSRFLLCYHPVDQTGTTIFRIHKVGIQWSLGPRRISRKITPNSSWLQSDSQRNRHALCEIPPLSILRLYCVTTPSCYGGRFPSYRSVWLWMCKSGPGTFTGTEASSLVVLSVLAITVAGVVVQEGFEDVM